MENIGERIKNMKPANIEVRLKNNENVERAIKRFMKKVKKERIVEDYRERIYYEKPSDKKRRLEKRRKATLDKLKAKEQTN